MVENNPVQRWIPVRDYWLQQKGVCNRRKKTIPQQIKPTLRHYGRNIQAWGCFADVEMDTCTKLSPTWPRRSRTLVFRDKLHPLVHVSVLQQDNEHKQSADKERLQIQSRWTFVATPDITSSDLLGIISCYDSKSLAFWLILFLFHSNRQGLTFIVWFVMQHFILCLKLHKGATWAIIWCCDWQLEQERFVNIWSHSNLCAVQHERKCGPLQYNNHNSNLKCLLARSNVLVYSNWKGDQYEVMILDKLGWRQHVHLGSWDS